MVQHVSIRDKSVSLVPINLNTENTGSYHHSELTVLFKGKLLVIRNFFANHGVVGLNVLYLFRYLILERTSLEPSSFLLSVENRKVVKSLRQNVDKLGKLGVFLPYFLHAKGR